MSKKGYKKVLEQKRVRAELKQTTKDGKKFYNLYYVHPEFFSAAKTAKAVKGGKKKTA